jgi:Flp pilus assembly protein TadD
LRLAALYLIACSALAQQPVNELLAKAKHCARAGDAICVVEQYRKLRAADPTNPEFRYLLGKAYAELATSTFRRMHRADPNAPRVQQLLGEHYLMQGQHAAAQVAFERALAADPTLPGIHLNLAQIYRERKDIKAALEELDRELAIVPDSAVAAAMKRQLSGSK